MNKQPFFYLETSANGLWGVVGPVTVVKLGNKSVTLSNGCLIEMNLLYRTKGGASKECHKRNYLLKAEKGVQ